MQFSFLVSLMGPPCIFLCGSLQTEQAAGHMSSSPVIYPWSSQVICLQYVDPFTSRAAAMGGLSPLKSPPQAMVTNCKVGGEAG